jgi:hypothetical protein
MSHRNQRTLIHAGILDLAKALGQDPAYIIVDAVDMIIRH